MRTHPIYVGYFPKKYIPAFDFRFRGLSGHRQRSSGCRLFDPEQTSVSAELTSAFRLKQTSLTGILTRGGSDRGYYSCLPFRSLARALSDQMEPFDRDYFTPRLGALRMAMPSIGKQAQRRHGVIEPGLRWGVSAPRLRCGARPIAAHRASHRA